MSSRTSSRCDAAPGSDTPFPDRCRSPSEKPSGRPPSSLYRRYARREIPALPCGVSHIPFPPCLSPAAGHPGSTPTARSLARSVPAALPAPGAPVCRLHNVRRGRLPSPLARSCVRRARTDRQQVPEPCPLPSCRTRYTATPPRDRAWRPVAAAEARRWLSQSPRPRVPMVRRRKGSGAGPRQIRSRSDSAPALPVAETAHPPSFVRASSDPSRTALWKMEPPDDAAPVSAAGSLLQAQPSSVPVHAPKSATLPGSISRPAAFWAKSAPGRPSPADYHFNTFLS